MQQPPPADPALAFPSAFRDAAARIALRLAPGEICPISSGYDVIVQGETVTIPRRVYYRTERLDSAIAAPGSEGMIALCLGTRHHDGFVRERCLLRLLGERQDWIVPFVVQLVGEYVAEIIARIEAALPQLDAGAYGRFLLENPRYLRTTESRVHSYYYVHADPRENAGTRIIAAFRRMRDAATKA